ncbi:MAG: Rne/Rng family ribonuclease, partial [Thermodesulfobacteriota bacterium]
PQRPPPWVCGGGSAEKEEKETEVKEEKAAKKTTAGRKGNGRKKKPAAKKSSKPASSSKKEDISYKLLINADEPEECRIALLENGKVESFNTETVVRAQTKGNIYKGIITAIEPNLQAAFVDMGTGKNGFLPFGDIHPEYYCKDVPESTHWKRLRIQEVVRKGQEVLVEVVKEPTGNKGANITTFLSMPGRYLVLMPGSDSHGISRQISDEARRAKLREIVMSAKLPDEIGYIIRTASAEVTKTALMKDIRFQLNLWKEIKAKGQGEKAPAIVYKEQDVVSRFLRDHFSPDIQEIMVDNQDTFDKVNQFLELLPARQRTANVKMHRGSKPIFNQYQVEEQIETMYQPQVSLPSGGSIVINPTEALVAIDVNSGRTSKDKDFEKSIFLANSEAAEELARQLRLRDLGGLIVVDFIDMRDKKNIREVEKRVKSSMKRDKAKVDMSRISKFGLMQISRQRLGPPIQKGNYVACEHCQGHGVVRSVETTALAIMRRIQTGAAKRGNKVISCNLPLKVAQYILNQKRADLLEIEQRYKVEIRITPNPDLNPSQGEVQFQQGKSHGKSNDNGKSKR